MKQDAFNRILNSSLFNMETLKLYVLFLSVVLNDCANILFSIPFTSKSHYIMLRPIGLELAKRGHHVTAITPFREKDPPANYHEVMVDFKEIWEATGMERPNVFTMVDLSSEDFLDNILWGGGLAFTDVALNSTEVQKFLKEDHKFDIVICEQFFQEAFYSLAHKYQAPLVLVTTSGNYMRCNIAMRNPLQLSTVLADYLTVKDPQSFWGRFRNAYFVMYEFFWWKYWYLPKQEALISKYVPNLPEPVPRLYDIQTNVSLLLVNSHFSFEGPIAYLPNIIEVGGLHLSKSDSELPKDFQNILDNAKDGVVYVNFGSNVRSSELPLAKKEAFLKVFSEIKQTVIWKWEDDALTNISSNIVIRKWLPQKEILAHPNIKVFIAHGGLIGMHEAIFNGVPIMGIPIYADQYNNLLTAENLGFGKILEYHDINEETFRRSLNDVISDASYGKKAKEISRRFKDRPMTALDTAVFWIEFVIRNNGADYIKNPALSMSWIESNMVDVYGFVILVCLVIVYVFIKMVKVLLGTEKKSVIGKKKRN